MVGNHLDAIDTGSTTPTFLVEWVFGADCDDHDVVAQTGSFSLNRRVCASQMPVSSDGTTEINRTLSAESASVTVLKSLAVNTKLALYRLLLRDLLHRQRFAFQRHRTKTFCRH